MRYKVWIDILKPFEIEADSATKALHAALDLREISDKVEEITDADKLITISVEPVGYER